MTAKTTRILKEARPLLWPWCAVTLAGALPLVLRQSDPILLGSNILEISLVFTGVGILLLATLSLGNEFQHRTLSLLLSQPVSRMEIWGEKMSVTFVAVLSAAMVVCYGWRSALQEEPKLWVFGGALVITTIASATFWTLIARSTLGGLVLSCMVPYFIVIVAWATLPERIRETGDFSLPAAIPVVSIATFALLCYAGVMLWLGRRTLARFQVTGGMAGDDLLMAVPGVMPEALAGLFRCRPTGPFLNLIRKELRLLRPLWLLTLLFLLYWTCLTMLRPSAVRESFGLVAIALATPALGLGGLIAMLAGCLSLGEERTSGTHSWHMTLPVPARRQWLIKLLMAVFTGFVCTLLLPLLVMAASEFIHGSPVIFFDILSEHHRLDSSSLHRLLIIVPLLSFVSFWCACAVNGMLRAALWVFPAMGAVLLAGVCGDWVGRELAQATVTPMDLVVSWFHFNPWYAIPDGPKVTWLVVPALLFGVIQSYRLFRTQREDSTLSVIRCLLPLALVAFLCSFSVSASGFGDYPRSRWLPFSEAGEAIEKLQLGVTKLDAAHPLQLTVEDLAKSSPMSALTRRWLRGSNIIVAPNQAHSGYFATIHLASGLDCRLAVGHYGGRPVFAWRPCVPRSP